MIVTLDEMKAHLNITGDQDDALIGKKIAAAQNHIERLLGFKIEETYGGAEQEDVPESLAEAVMQLAAHWYENREAVIVGVTAIPMPLGVREIIREYRDWSF
ncbi:head-tail connector protein [Martelella mediterranea]|uniref:Putative phage protein (Possible DNA packaging) n=1 Tax=Martelella mediterranea DSM 17316 TaxID=1122214 RepID=A0A1U9YYL1_9HYPH|nr:head-tail connector protein [Martelella mediterranea]AQZ50531.1 putative phage protein (possible DNA packaging) [Martelella mediterranea DSM 17316]